MPVAALVMAGRIHLLSAGRPTKRHNLRTAYLNSTLT